MHWKWNYIYETEDMMINNRGEEPDEEFDRGRHGYLKYMPWWACKASWNDKFKRKVGCYNHKYDWYVHCFGWSDNCHPLSSQSRELTGELFHMAI